MAKTINCKQPLRQLSKKSVRLIGRWLRVSNLDSRWVLMIRLSSLTRMLTLPRFGPSTFVMYFGESEVTTDTDLTVVVGSGKDATMLMVDVSADMILVEDDESVTVTVTLRDEDGNDVPAAEDMEVDLVSSNAIR